MKRVAGELNLVEELAFDVAHASLQFMASHPLANSTPLYRRKVAEMIQSLAIIKELVKEYQDAEREELE